jgi:hypothetical protein
MNDSQAHQRGINHKPGMHLLDTIRALRAGVGDGLNDDELTRLLRPILLPNEAGFGFLSFSGGFVTPTVPQQEQADWYQENGWVAATKERIVRAIAEKHQLSLSEPPDEAPSSLLPPVQPPGLHHHLEFSNRWETVVLAHPCYLKVRLFGARSAFLYTRLSQNPLPLRPDLLPDLSALYRGEGRDQDLSSASANETKSSHAT